MEQKKQPLVSIILPTKNNDRTIFACIDSIAKQTYSPIEVVLVDNFSTDPTRDIAAGFSDRLDITVLQKGPERHVQRAFGFEASKGKYVYFLDSDMYLAPTVVEKAVNALENDEKIAGVIVSEENVAWTGYWTNVKAFERNFYIGDPTTEAARFFRREAYESVGGYNQKLIAGEDWDLHDRFLKHGFKIAGIEPLIQHDEGEIQLGKLLSKKFYYGGKLQDFVQENGSGSLFSRIYFFRPIYYKKWRRFFQYPTLVPGFFAMLTLELAAGWTGLLISKAKSLRK